MRPAVTAQNRRLETLALFITSLVVASLLGISPIQAQDTRERYPARFVDRPILLMAGTLQLEAEGTFRYRRGADGTSSAAPDARVGLAGSLAYAVADFVTIGGTPFATEFFPETDLGNPSAFVGVGIPVDGFGIAIYGRVTFPVAQDSELRVDASLPIWIALDHYL